MSGGPGGILHISEALRDLFTAHTMWNETAKAFAKSVLLWTVPGERQWGGCKGQDLNQMPLHVLTLAPASLVMLGKLLNIYDSGKPRITQGA
jgi:hypothetical protein